MRVLLFPITIILYLFKAIFWLLKLIFQSDSEASENEQDPFENTKSDQAELDAYISKSKSGFELGLLYERYIGYLLETEGYNVTFHGAINGYADLGIDLIAHEGNKTLIIQTKYWAKHKVIPEKHVLHLYACAIYYKKKTNYDNVKPVFYSTTEFSDRAKEIAQTLNVELRRVTFDRTYPMIKCNINQNGEKIFHLPTDEFYDKVKIDYYKKEFYVNTVAEAQARGFRRAQKLQKPKSAG